MTNSDEFENIKKGLPREVNRSQSTLHIIVPFIIAGFCLAGLIVAAGLLGDLLLTADSIKKMSSFLVNFIYGVSTSIYMGAISFLVGMIHSILFRKRIISRIVLYLLVASLAGLVSGFIGGALFGYALSDNSFEAPLIQSLLGSNADPLPRLLVRILILSMKGAIPGLLVGLLIGSSIAASQSLFMHISKYRLKWRIYTVVVWSTSSCLAWMFSTTIGDFIDLDFIADAIAALFVLLCHGISTILLLMRAPELELS